MISNRLLFPPLVLLLLIGRRTPLRHYFVIERVWAAALHQTVRYYIVGMTIYTVKSCYLHSRLYIPDRALRAYPFCTFSALFLYFLRCTSPTLQPYSTTLLTITAAHNHQLEHPRVLILPAVYALPIPSLQVSPCPHSLASLRV